MINPGNQPGFNFKKYSGLNYEGEKQKSIFDQFKYFLSTFKNPNS